MALIDYKCEDGHIIEEMFRMSDKRPTHIVCPVCGKPAEKQFPLVARTVSRWGPQGDVNKY